MSSYYYTKNKQKNVKHRQHHLRTVSRGKPFSGGKRVIPQTPFLKPLYFPKTAVFDDILLTAKMDFPVLHHSSLTEYSSARCHNGSSTTACTLIPSAV